MVRTKSQKPSSTNETKTFAKGEVIADFFTLVTHALLIHSGRIILEALDSHDKPMKNFRIELGPGQIVFDELLAQVGSVATSYRASAIEETVVEEIAIHDPTSSDASVIKALAETNIKARRQQVIHHEDEAGVLTEIDALRERVRELESENAKLEEKAKQLDEINRKLTHNVVNKAVLDKLRELSTQVRELTGESRNLKRQVIERTNEAKSALDYASTLTDDLQKLERLRDLLELEATEPRVFLSEVHRAFLAILTSDNRELQRLGVDGLGVLSALSRNSAPPPADDPSD